ncbi:glycosyltransferase [Devosia sp. SD17-2]|uniref:glycosyltransferase n=1 Tax=Devosia sp. SD17-2 TaxID=2976459 RepID=UPI0023D7C3A9|nr:glycosyltransferase [Devosia sp. SD17-2]WEJ32919.1 glycosyltransferase [Devosia sp. SD17-2]
MKIALVTPLASPLALGGAENLWWGLQNHFNTQTEHQCDIVSIPSPEGNFWDLIGSYETFSQLDLSAYDCVISGKYPGWMVNHPNHICYMLHRLRGLYDTYAGAPLDIAAQPEKLRALLSWVEDAGTEPGADAIPLLFERLKALRGDAESEAALGFPGPVSRAIIHFLDNAALSGGRVRRHAAIAGTVARRKDYFPADASVDVLYPPPHRDDYFCGSQDYFFTSSRLDRPKRVDLIIEAYRQVETDLPLLIAGSGPDEERLKALANGDERIRFLGFVADGAMAGLYANALAVPFVPFDEDYGLITIEAMRSGKPVITVNDAGGPTEFVTDGVTGLVTAPAPQDLAKALAALANDPVRAAEMGREARKSVDPITWAKVAEGLIAAPTPRVIRPKLTVATTFKVFPPMNGGQARVYHLYRNLARHYDIDIVSLGGPADARSEMEIAPGLLEITIPRSQDHADAEYFVSRQVGERPVGDITTNALFGLTPDYVEALELSAIASEAVIACHPFMIEAIAEAAPDKPLWYEAQDVELTLKSAVFSAVPEAEPLMAEVTRAERAAWTRAERVFACAHRDLHELERVYGPTRARLSEVPNGVSLDDIRFVDLAERRRLKAAGGLSGQVAMFLGSWHGPNLEAVEDILAQAPRSPDTRFFIIGSVCLPFKDRVLPANVELMGAVDMETRDLMLSIADVALNPMRSGTGTNLKMLDYMAAGVPVISSAFGARGLAIDPDVHYVQGENESMAQSLARLANTSDDALQAMITAARARAKSEYSWRVIAERFIEELTRD